jgi:5S rRNA maturation endonuclease (ribonuclease M5)
MNFNKPRSVSPATKERILEALDIPTSASGDAQVRCPFHDDSNESASYHVEKGLLHCFTCNRGWNDFQLEKELVEVIDEEIENDGRELLQAGREHSVRSDKERGVAAAPAWVGPEPDGSDYLKSRGLAPTHIPDWHVRDGYFWFDADERVGRDIVGGEGRPRYKNEKGAKGLYWIGARLPHSARTIWLCEGVLDAMSLKQLMPHQAICASLGSSVSDAQAYELKGKTVFIVYDADHAGYRGARKVQETLREYEANGIVLDFPKKLGNDINYALVNHPELLREWINSARAEYSTTDDLYVHRLFREDAEPLLTIETGSYQWDLLLKGGFRPGLHILGAESGVGKTSWAVGFAVTSAFAGWRTLYNTNEVAKRQVWSRIAATQNGRSWAEIEADPLSVSDEITTKLERLGQQLRVVSGWNIPKIKYVAEHYDIIIVDYMQRVSTKFGQDSNKAAMDYVAQELSDLGRDLGKIVIGISSVSRAGYGGEFSKRDLKESGGLEYIAQSVTGMQGSQSTDLVQMSVVKNTRGKQGTFWLNADLEHQIFTDATALSNAVLPKKKQQSKLEETLNDHR